MPDMYNLLNATMSRQAEALELIHTSHETNLNFQRKKESKRKDRFNKFHPDTKKMIMFASAPDAEAAPNVPEDTYERFINATSQGVAEQELCIQFRQMGLGEMAYATGLILNLYNGRFLYAIRNNPSNFSCFSIHEGSNVGEEEQQSRQLLLHLIEKEGKGRSVEEPKAFNKQILKAPSSYRDMVLQFNYFRGLCQIFFGQFSWACQAMILLIETLEKNKNSFQARARSDPHFCSKFMYAVDLRYQIWLKDCSLVTRHEQVNDRALQFGTLIEMVCFGRPSHLFSHLRYQQHREEEMERTMQTERETKEDMTTRARDERRRAATEAMPNPTEPKATRLKTMSHSRNSK